jgi:glycosyltransferase involved in cell wall biosynthesis
LFGVAQWLPVPYVALHPQLRAPRTTVLLHQTTLIVPEVMSRDVADRLTTWQRVGLNVSTRFIVHDMLPLTHSEYFAPGSTHEHLLNLTAFTEAERLFVATPLLAHDLEQFATAMGRSVPELKIVELPIEVHEQSIQPGPRPSDPYVVFMGGFEPRKGLSTFVDYVTAHRDPRDSFRVIIVGTPPMITRRNLFDLLKRIARRSDVFEIRSGLTDDELHALLAGALATIYVSAAEGYGLPVLESLALGTPVITADSELNHHLNELFGGIMPIFDHSTETIDAIRELMNPAHRNVASASIARSRLPRSIDDWADQVTDGLPND